MVTVADARTSPAGAARRRSALELALGWAQRNALFFGLLILLGVFSLMSSRFLTGANVEVALLQASVVGLMAVPGAMLILSGYVDLSVGSLAVLSSVLFGTLVDEGAAVWTGVVVALVVGAAWGLTNGFLIAHLGFSPIIVTLGGLAAGRGLAELITRGTTTFSFGSGFAKLGNGELAGVAVPIWILLAAFAIGGYVWYRTPYGRHMTAIGADRGAARSLGLAVRRIPVGARRRLALDRERARARGADRDSARRRLVRRRPRRALRRLHRRALHRVPRERADRDQRRALRRGHRARDRARPRGRARRPVRAARPRALRRRRLDRAALPARAPLAGPSMTGEPAVLELRSISKSFGAVTALDGVSVALGKAEVLGLVGDNGAGKSTLVNVVSGLLKPDQGAIVVDGAERAFASAAEARDAGIETVFQSLSLIPTLDIAENVFLGRELLAPTRLGRVARWMTKRRMREEVVAGFERLGLWLPPPYTKVGALSGGQRQSVAIARAVLWGSHIVVMDEPAAALGVRQTEIVLDFIEQLKRHGVAVIVISHNMQHVMRVADRIVVLRLGEKVFDVPKAETTAQELVGVITGAL
jgi:ABC-type branched-subunit amino acid transport system ATPase component